MRKRKRKNLVPILFFAVAGAAVLSLGIRLAGELGKEKPEELLVRYMGYIESGEYEKMYEMVDVDTLTGLDREGFIERNSRIYEGIEVHDLKISDIQETDRNGKTVTVAYDTSMDTVAGEISFSNEVVFENTKEGYLLLWKDALIFPELTATEKVSVTTHKAARGKILDRNGKTLAGPGTAVLVGIVPGKLREEENPGSLKRIAQLLEMDEETIRDKLAASWVREDSFVPLTTIPEVLDMQVLLGGLSEEMQKEQERQEQLLAIPGVMLTDVEVRSYPLGEAASHLIGYVQNVTAEDLEEHEGEGYDSSSVIGRSGMEALYEKELKGRNGCEISIVDQNGNKRAVLASIPKQDGQNIQLTIDSELQTSLYRKFAEDPGCSVAVQPYTGEVLALVSTPSYDNNDFIMGMSDEQWTSLNEDEKMPLYNRFRQIWCPGSSLKPVVAGIGLKTGAIDPDEDSGSEGLSWQKDSSWGSYYVTTLHDYSPVNLTNALIYSDNIYFAKAALKIGADAFVSSLESLGFGQELPFEITMTKSQYSNTDKIETEIQLADSGYGQGQILVNPLHLASMYTAFLNGGDMLKPKLRYEEDSVSEIWIPQAFSEEIVDQVMEGLYGVVNNSGGTGYGAHREDMTLAGKTGTAELKASQEDTSGTEIGWFSVFTTDRNAASPILLVSMVEDVKNLGGSGYVVEKDAQVLDEYFTAE